MSQLTLQQLQRIYNLTFEKSLDKDKLNIIAICIPSLVDNITLMLGFFQSMRTVRSQQNFSVAVSAMIGGNEIFTIIAEQFWNHYSH